MATAPFWISRPSFSRASVAIGRPAASLRVVAGVEATPRDVAAEARGVVVEALDAEQMAAFTRDWADLVARAVEPNGFLEPGFALELARHFPARFRPSFVAVWKRGAAARRLIALFPIVPPSFALGGAVTRGWLHKQAALATPLLDRDDVDEAATALVGFLASYAPGGGALLFPTLPISGPAFAALTRAAQATGRGWRVTDPRERALLQPGGDPRELWTRNGSGKALSELRRRRRRLEEAGALTHKIYSEPAEIGGAAEAFLALEASGWKATRGALLGHPSLATFMRSATRLLAREGKCKIHSLELDGKPIAMGVVIESGGRAYFWKIAYDESLRAQAPGVQLVYALTETQTRRAEIDTTDSCAIPGHAMIERSWPERLTVCDLMIQANPHAPSRFAAACAGEKLRRRLRASAKTAFYRVMKRKER
ncbi:MULTISPECIES: GNAT family N-acetyltransferase [Methylosinus]|uniref:GNAT family N-acetyltransferase n=1 Tax=Methylosinus trichosporium (strain ATCC 35070 / NCIMB 11131 / UNIQEM 75 / OB3b) TaxID=595536 RepID=A0A2D2D5R3_METT3|nr:MULTISPECIES: GNAT family N-acetyltransferase [Methylosinus]ATQ70304.1 GNAT family N-acetyltransferase [Methylosinus trichosporium OB3b]OBS53798.1 acyl-CoA acyltransferase [Methylosinus sp. 3S-1]